MNNRVIIFNNVTAEFVEVGPKLAAAFLEKNKTNIINKVIALVLSGMLRNEIPFDVLLKDICNYPLYNN